MAKKTLDERIQRLEDIHEISNLMGRNVYYQLADMQEAMNETKATKTPGVTFEVPEWGVWEGPEGIEKMAKYHRLGVGDSTGKISAIPITTPVIEVAADGKTAKGLWICPGAETGRWGPGGKMQAYWAWAKYGVDFVKEDGKWKVWHNQVYSIFFTPYEKSWVEEYKHPEFKVPEEFRATRPPTYNWHYSPNVKTENVPPPPLPYETWDGKSMTTANMK
jgi:hypothetical protein